MERKSSFNDCFAQFDAAFAELSAELEHAPDSPDRPASPSPDRPASPQPLQLIAPAVTSFIETHSLDEVEADEPAAEQDPAVFDEALDRLDALMAKVGGVEGVTLHATRPAPPEPAATVRSAIVVPTRVPVFRESQLWRPGPNGGTPLERLLGTLDNLSLIASALDKTTVAGRGKVNDLEISRVLADAADVCHEFDLKTGSVRVEFALEALDREPAELKAEIAELIRHIRHDAQACTIRPIASSRAWALNLTLGELAAAFFPAAEAEMAEGGRCFALERYTACVFHMLRAAEYGLTALTDEGEPQRVSVGGNRDWMTLLRQIDARISAIGNSPANARTPAALEFFYDVLRDARELHRATRKLAGAGTAFDESEARDVCQATRGFLMRVCARKMPADQAPPLPQLTRPARSARKLSGTRGAPEVAADRKS